MSADRELIYEQKHTRRGMSPEQPQAESREAAIQYVVETTQMLIDAYMQKGFAMDVSIMLTSQVLPKLL